MKAVREETAEARSFVLVAERGDKAAFHYLPGQFLNFRIPHADGQIVRCYSLSSAPCTDPDMTICVKRVANGHGSSWMHDHLRVGARIEATRPSGRFVLRPGDAPVLLIAGGSGITPCLALIKQILSETARQVKLLYANQNAKSVIYRDTLARLENRFAERFTCRHWLDDERGYLRFADLTAEVGGWTEADTYVCGPAPLTELAEDTLETLLSEGASVLIERFASPDDTGASASARSDVKPVETVQQDSPTTDLPSDDHSHDDCVPELCPTVESGTAQDITESFRLVLDGEEHEVPIGAGETLLHAALAAGIDAPHSCAEGHCGMCMGRLLSGKVSMASTRALSRRNIAHGLVLACQSTPVSSEQILLNFDF